MDNYNTYLRFPHNNIYVPPTSILKTVTTKELVRYLHRWRRWFIREVNKYPFSDTFLIKNRINTVINELRKRVVSIGVNVTNDGFMYRPKIRTYMYYDI